MTDEEKREPGRNYTKKQIDDIFNNFVESVWKIIPDKRHDAELTKEEVRVCFQEFMKNHGTIEAWDEDEFNMLVNKFEDDDAEESNDNKDQNPVAKKDDESIRYSKTEFLKLVRYIT